MSEYSEIWWSSNASKLFARDYRSAGGPARLPVVCLHGLTRNSSDFDEVARLISRSGRRVIVPDIRGRGKSGRGFDPNMYMPATYADDILEMLSSLGIERAVFLGTSMGGIITLILALKRFGVIAAAILNEAGPEVAAAGVDRISNYIPIPADLDDWSVAVDLIQMRYADAYPQWSTGEWQSFARKSLVSENGKLVGNYDPNIFEPIQNGKLKQRPMISWFAFKRLARKRPCMLLRGQLSDLIDEKIANKMKRRAPSMQIVEVPSVGHAPNLNERESIEGIMGFLATVP